MVAARRDREAFGGRVPATPWDPGLQEVLEEEGVAVYEEDIRVDLLASMRSG